MGKMMNGIPLHDDEWERLNDLLTRVKDAFLRDILASRAQSVQVGDTVKVVDDSLQYPYYAEWVYENVSGADKCKYAFGHACSVNTVGRVIYVGEHSSSHEKMLYIQTEQNVCYLVDAKSVVPL